MIDKFKTTSVTFTLRVTLGAYQHEELTATVEPLPDEFIDGADLMREARRVCLSNTTARLKKQEGDK